ncbi:outer membrane protein, partial [Klebsiella aerogenes]|uniref:outer membrane protein n=1 Tax=Klebsiella aerogenes TaxID=548 RepID=UPI0013D8CC2C
AQAERTGIGFTLGAGVQYAVPATIALGLDYRYLDLGSTGRFTLGAVPGLGPVSTRAASTANQMLARLIWYPQGLRLPPEAEAPED